MVLYYHTLESSNILPPKDYFVSTTTIRSEIEVNETTCLHSETLSKVDGGEEGNRCMT
jgi:hypothetical protein